MKIFEKTVVCMTTFNRIDCARINQEIIKLNYSNPFPIVHACSSENYKKHLEDTYIPCKQKKLQEGALHLLIQSIKSAIDTFAPQYIVHIEGDTWIMEEQVIYDLIEKMDCNQELMICTSAWDEDEIKLKHSKCPSAQLTAQQIFANLIRKLGSHYKIINRDSLATQFFIIRNSPQLLECIYSIKTDTKQDLEQLFYHSFMQVFSEKNILRLNIREPVHPNNRNTCKKLSLYAQHWPAKGTAKDPRSSAHFLYVKDNIPGKKDTLIKYKKIRNGKYIKKLLNSECLDYYNLGALRY